MLFLRAFLKILFLMTPFFVLSMFLSMTPGWSQNTKKRLAVRVGVAILAVCLSVLFFGKLIFDAFGITLDSFRIGGGAMLFLSSVGLVNSDVRDKMQKREHALQDVSAADISKIALVPLAIPVTVGPATLAFLMIQSAEAGTFLKQAVYALAMAAAVAVLTLMLLISSWLEEKVGINAIIVLSKLTGLILAAMASQMIFSGIRGFLC